MATCRVCGKEAAVRLRYANLWLCREHFLEFFERRVERTLRRYGMVREGDRIGVAVSGGKDSMVALYVLSRLGERVGFEVCGLHIDLGISAENYSRVCLQRVVEAFRELGLVYRVLSLKEEYGFTVEEAAKRVRRPQCAVCGLVRRYVLNKMALEMGVTKLATGHHLNDFAVFIVNNVVHANYAYLARLKPMLLARAGLVARIRPLLETPEHDIAAYARFLGIRYADIRCPYGAEEPTKVVGRFLEIVEKRSPGITMMMVRGFIARCLPILESRFGEEEVRACKECGYPTTGDLCAFCRLLRRIGARG